MQQKGGTSLRALSILAAAAAVVFSWAIPTQAFTYNGLRTGMSVAEATDAARAAGLPAIAPITNVDGMYRLGAPADARVFLQFCQDKLFSVTTQIVGGIDAFAELTGEMNQKYGNPVVQSQHGYNAQGLLSSVRMTWATEGGEEANVDFTSLAGNAGVNTGYSAFDVICPKPAR